MSEAAPTPRNKLWTTPMRDLLRGRITGRLEWQSRMSQLPAPAATLIAEVVKRSRLWRLEQAGVADELIAHFQDGLAARTAADEVVKRFGDPLAAAKLIRRAKQRNRPLPWHVWNFAFRAVLVLVAVYVVCLIRFCIGKPNPSVDWVARMNAPVLKAREADRAWPIWRKAILASIDSADDNGLHWPKTTGQDPLEKVPWAETARWLDQHAAAMELCRQAGQKRALGFVLGPAGSADDPELHFPHHTDRNSPLVTLLLPHLSPLRQMGRELSLDARRAAELHDGARALADLSAMLGLARQLRKSDGIIVTQMVGVGIEREASNRMQQILVSQPDVVSDAQLVQIAHELAGPRVAADLVSITGERRFFQDILQRTYTDNGSGDGHMTLAGAHEMPMYMTQTFDTNYSSPVVLWGLASTVPMITPSRREITAKYDQLMIESESNFHRNLRDIDGDSVDAKLIALHESPLDRVRFAMLCALFPSSLQLQSSCERYLGLRDGTLVAIALELYHRRHGRYPSTLDDLTPELLPHAPADRITGDPVKYRLIDGKPIVYSVGADRIDDGGRPPEKSSSRRDHERAATWDVKPADAPRGDWVLYPAVPADDP